MNRATHPTEKRGFLAPGRYGYTAYIYRKGINCWIMSTVHNIVSIRAAERLAAGIAAHNFEGELWRIDLTDSRGASVDRWVLSSPANRQAVADSEGRCRA